MKQLNKKIFDEFKIAVKESTEQDLKKQLDLIEKIKQDTVLKKYINESQHIGTILTKALNCIPKQVLKDNVGTNLFRYRPQDKTEHERLNRQYYDFFLVSDTTNVDPNINRKWNPFEGVDIEKINFYIFRPHKDLLDFYESKSYNSDNKKNSANWAAWQEYEIEYVSHSRCFGYALNSDGQINYMHKYFGKLMLKEKNPTYLSNYLEQDNILPAIFAKEVSENLLAIAKKGRKNNSLLEETLASLSIIPEEWIIDKLK